MARDGHDVIEMFVRDHHVRARAFIGVEHALVSCSIELPLPSLHLVKRVARRQRRR